MAIKIAVTNAKGGVAKTTTAISLADALMSVGYKVLFIDLDPQTNSTGVYTYHQKEERRKSKTLKNVLKREDINDCIFKAKFGDIILGDTSLADEDGKYYQYARTNPGILREALKKVEGNYSFIIIDTPPNLGTWMKTALYTADDCIIPITPEKYAVDGFGNLLDFIEKIQEKGNKNLRIIGTVLTRYDCRNKRDKDIKATWPSVCKRIGIHPFKTCIRTCQDVSKAYEQGESLFQTKGNSNAAMDYVNLLYEVLKEINR